MSERLDTLVEVASEAAWQSICETSAHKRPFLDWADVPEPAKRLVRDRQRAGLEAVLPLVEEHLAALKALCDEADANERDFALDHMPPYLLVSEIRKALGEGS